MRKPRRLTITRGAASRRAAGPRDTRTEVRCSSCLTDAPHGPETLTVDDFGRFAPRVLGRRDFAVERLAFDLWLADGYGRIDEAAIAAYLRRAVTARGFGSV